LFGVAGRRSRKQVKASLLPLVEKGRGYVLLRARSTIIIDTASTWIVIVYSEGFSPSSRAAARKISVARFLDPALASAIVARPSRWRSLQTLSAPLG